MPPPGPILFYRPGGLGDVLAAVPAMRAARAASPGRPAVLAAAGAPGRMVLRLGLVDAFLPIDDPGLACLFADPGPAAARLEIPGPPPSSLWAWLLREPAAEFRVAAGRRFSGDARIVVYDPASGLPVGRFFFARAAETLGIDSSGSAYERFARLPDPGPPTLPLPESPFAVLHPGSGSPRKNAPMEIFLAATEDLARRGMGGFVAIGPAEKAAPKDWERVRLPGGWRLLSEPSLTDLAGLLARCSAYIGNDSGVTHLAAAAGAPVLAFFRDENLPAWRPCGRSDVISVPEPSAISPDAVLAAVARFPAPSALQWRL